MGDPRVTVAKILAPQGVRGEVRVLPLTDFPERFQKRKELWLGPPQDRRVRLESARAHGRVWLLKLAGIDDRNAAESLRGLELQVDEEALEPLEEGRFYVHHLVGLPVVTADGSEVGRLRDILQTGANDVFVIRRDGASGPKEYLIPAMKEFLEVDLAGGKIVLRPIPGMIEE